MKKLSLDDELELACLLDIDDGILYQHCLFDKLFKAYRAQKAKIESLQEWIKVIERQLERYKAHGKS